MFSRFHHVAIICSAYDVAKAFYTEVLGFSVVDERWREDSQSWKADLASGEARIELFQFANSPLRPTRPEAQGLRHVAFAVPSVSDARKRLMERGVSVDPIRIDKYTGKPFVFFYDPDGLPLEC